MSNSTESVHQHPVPPRLKGKSSFVRKKAKEAARAIHSARETEEDEDVHSEMLPVSEKKTATAEKKPLSVDVSKIEYKPKSSKRMEAYLERDQLETNENPRRPENRVEAGIQEPKVVAMEPLPEKPASLPEMPEVSYPIQPAAPIKISMSRSPKSPRRIQLSRAATALPKVTVTELSSMPRIDDTTDDKNLLMDSVDLYKRRKSLTPSNQTKLKKFDENESGVSQLVTGGSIKGTAGWMRVDEIIQKTRTYTLARVTRLIDDTGRILKLVKCYESGAPGIIENEAARLELEYQTIRNLEKLGIPNLVKVTELGEVSDLGLKYLSMMDYGCESIASISSKRISTGGRNRMGYGNMNDDILPSGFLLREVLHIFTETTRFLSRLHRSGLVLILIA